MKMDAVPENILEKVFKLFYKQYKYKEICKIIQAKYGFQISLQKLKIIYKNMNLRRKNINCSPLVYILLAIIMELNDSGANLGYRAMWRRLIKQYGLTVKQKAVLRILRIVDPEGVEARRRKRLRRRAYTVPGPNYLWHADGHDKLKKFGFAIHGCIDGFSKKIIWLRVARTNNDPRVVGRYFIEKIKKLKFIPTILRTDHGTENANLRDFQQALRFSHEDENAGESSFLIGKSTSNQRIESHWSIFRRHALDFFIQLFKNMQDSNLLNIKNVLHIEALRYSFGPLIEHCIHLSKKEWNEHRIRKQNFRNVRGGIPNVLYHCPDWYDGYECKKNVNLEHVEILEKEYTCEPQLVDPQFKEFFDSLFGSSVACTSEEAYYLYIRTVDVIDEILHNNQ